MEKEFWLERWEKQEIGFHQDEVNPYLNRYWPELNLAHSSEVFVPLCGKSRDMLWLREQGHKILGVELSDIAVQAFFRENGYTPSRVTGKRFDCCEADDIRLLCGDFFDLNGDDLAKVTAVYDRASLVALPPEMQGPPFAVSSDEVQALYRDYAEVRLLAQLEVLAQNPHFKARGLSRLQENIFLLALH